MAIRLVSQHVRGPTLRSSAGPEVYAIVPYLPLRVSLPAAAEAFRAAGSEATVELLLTATQRASVVAVLAAVDDSPFRLSTVLVPPGARTPTRTSECRECTMRIDFGN